jgi:hypothetical protein
MKIHFRRSAAQPEPTTAYFSGHRGSGKSSMLFRLLEHLQEEHFTIYMDIEHNLDKHNSNQIDLLYLLGSSIFKAADDEGLQPNEANLEALAESVYTITYQTKEAKNESANIAELVKNLVVFGASALGGGIAEKLTEAALKPFSLSSGVSEEVARKREIQPQTQVIINNVNLIISDVEARSDKPLLVIIDGLDKVERIEQAKLIFTETDALSAPVCNLIYTVPMLLVNSTWFRRTEEAGTMCILPNIKLYDRSDATIKYLAGYDFLETVVSKRLAAIGLTKGDKLAEDALMLLSEKSGGNLLLFINMIRAASIEAEIAGSNTINRDIAIKTIDEEIARFGYYLTREKVKELKEVHSEKRPSESPLSSELIHGQLIVAYRNSRIWFDAHPLIWDEL